MANEIDINSSQYTPQSVVARRRLAEAMLKESMDPVKGNGGNVSWTQGLAKMAQAMMGGYELNQLDQEDKKAASEDRALAAAQYGGVVPGATPSTGTAPVPGAAPPPSANTPADKKEFGLKVYDAFKQAGYSDEQAAAIAGNMAWEGAGRSDLVNPWDNIRNSPKAPHSVGIAQWNDRSPALLDFARQKGIDIPQGDLRDKGYAQDAIRRIPLETQLEFAAWEMQNGEKRAGDGIRGAKTLPEAAAQAIGYHRPAGWTLNNPMAGHGYSGRLQLASDVLAAARSRQPVGFVPEDQNDPALQAPPLASAGVPPAAQPPAAPQAAPTPPPGPPSGSNLPLATPPAPPAPIAGGQQLPAAPGSNLPPSAPAPASRGDLLERAYASFGPQGALIRQMTQSTNRSTADKARAIVDAQIAKLQAMDAPADYKGRLDAADKQTKIDEHTAKLPGILSDNRGKAADASRKEAEVNAALTGRPDPFKMSEATATNDAKYALDQKVANDKFSGIQQQIKDARKVADLPGFDEGLRLSRMSVPLTVNAGGLGTVGGDPMNVAKSISRMIKPDAVGWAPMDEIKTHQSNLELIATGLLMAKQGQVTEGERAIVRDIAQLSNATGAADYQFKLNSIERKMAVMRAGGNVDKLDEAAVRPSNAEIQSVIDTRNNTFSTDGIKKLSEKYNVSPYHMQQYVVGLDQQARAGADARPAQRADETKALDAMKTMEAQLTPMQRAMLRAQENREGPKTVAQRSALIEAMLNGQK